MSAELLKFVNTGVNSLRPYEPGKPAEELERELGVTDVIKLASNENPLGPAPGVREVLRDWRGDMALYPDGNGFRLKQRLAEIHDIDPACITLGNGSNDILDLVARLFLGPGRAALFAQYGFAIYRLVTLAANGVAREVPALPEQGDMPLGHDLDAFAAALDDNVRVIFIASPNNPTGTWSTAEAIENLLQRVPSDVLVLLDEAYREYLHPDYQPPSREWLRRYPNLVITRTFSKVHGLAGLRVGYALSSPGIADLMNRVRQPFNVNALGLLCAEKALQDDAHIRDTLALNNGEREKLRVQLEERGLKVLPSQANFLTLHCGGASTPVYEGLLQQGVIVRPLAGYAMPEYLRVTIGRPEQNQRFMHALDKALAPAGVSAHV